MASASVGFEMAENEYVLGTNDAEISRLGLQHRAWRTHALSAWRSARICPGQSLLDVGCGPGYASLDLAETVGPSGRVVAIDKSERFLDVLDSMRRDRRLDNVVAQRVDLESGEFPPVRVDRVWCRWVLSFVKNPRDVLAKMAAVLQPGGAIVLHEYFDYSTWRAAPRCPELEEFVATVITSWRETGGDPDIGLQLPGWLEEAGLAVTHIRPIVDIVEPDSIGWAWLRAFIQVGRQRLVDLSYLSAGRAEEIWRVFDAFASSGGSRMITPALLEVVASARGFGNR